jgi:hypothetical protein
MIDFRTQPRRWNLPLTYEPKIQPVKEGTCRQTIRTVKTNKRGEEIRKEVGDLVRFYRWTGLPYRSKQEKITEYMPLLEAEPIVIFPTGIAWPKKWDWTNHPVFHEWDSAAIWNLSQKDGIVPHTGLALRDVLIGKNGEISPNGQPAQILRW